MEHILKDWGNFLRFLLGIVVVFTLLSIIVYRVSDNTEFNVDYSTDKTLITIIDKKNVIAYSVLPACDCWVNTGIEIRPEEEFELKVSGKIHTTADKMIKDADEDIMPRFPWIGPKGDKNFRIRLGRYRQSDSLRKTLLVAQKANMGEIVFYIQKSGSKPDCNVGPNFFLPDTLELYDIEKGLKGLNNTKSTWYIWATVNDMLIRDFKNESNRLAYLGGALGDTSYDRKQKQWQILASENYNRIWYDDNFGNFVISAKILRPNQFWNLRKMFAL